jgi:hypothetical protein
MANLLDIVSEQITAECKLRDGIYTFTLIMESLHLLSF